MNIHEIIIENAKKHNKRIVFPESFEERTLKAADFLLSNGIAKTILLGKPEEIIKAGDKLSLKNIKNSTIIDIDNFGRKNEYADTMVELRKSKGLTKEEALKLLGNPLYFATMMIKMGDADGEVAGAMNATGDVLRPAFQFIKTMKGISVVSGAFIMIVKDKSYGDEGVIVFADCAVNPNPNEKELAEIAISTARTAKIVAGLEPRVAMLSFSTKGSATHELCDKVIKATEIARQMDITLQIDGELQADAALVEAVGKKKAPQSSIAGKANVLIFPDLQAGNIAYKLVQRLAGAEAIGPISQGLAAPISDLSRGCTWQEIVEVAAITVNQASGVN
ncbi:MAG: phosphate acetyltransferase [Ignavibacteria bacterium]